MFSCNLPLALLAEWPGFLRATAVIRGWNGYRNKSQHRKLTLEKKSLPPLLPGLEPATFWSRVRRSNHWAIPAHRACLAVTCHLHFWQKDRDLLQAAAVTEIMFAYGVQLAQTPSTGLRHPSFKEEGAGKRCSECAASRLFSTTNPNVFIHTHNPKTIECSIKCVYLNIEVW